MTADDFWTRHVFVLLSPDSLRRGLQTAMVRRLADEGFPAVAARLVTAAPETIDDVYADVIAGEWQTWRYRLVDDLFTSGPSLALICRAADTIADPHAVLGNRKGHQDPRTAAPGTIRKDFGAVNSVLGLMHSSDGPGDSCREAAIFGLTARDFTSAADVLALCELAGAALPEQRGFDEVLAGVRARILACHWDKLPASLRAALHDEFPRAGELARPGAGRDLADLLSAAMPAGLAGVLRCEFTPEWRERARMHDVVRDLHANGIVLDPWEHLVLETSLYFHPARGVIHAPGAPEAASGPVAQDIEPTTVAS